MDGRTDRQSHMTKLIITFRNFANAPKQYKHFLNCLKMVIRICSATEHNKRSHSLFQISTLTKKKFRIMLFCQFACTKHISRYIVSPLFVTQNVTTLPAVQLKWCTSSYTQCFRPIWNFIRYWLRQVALGIEEEASEVLHLEHRFIWSWNLIASGSISEIPGTFWNVVLEKDGEDQLDRPCEKRRSIT